jgi:hypothetical protein
MKIDYILTAFSPAMFGEGATVHIKAIHTDEAQGLASAVTKIVATRVSHDRLARNTFPNVSDEVTRYANLRPGTNAIHLHYRGPQVPEDGRLPIGAAITCYLVEVEDYQDKE